MRWADLSKCEHISDPCTDFSTGEDSVYVFGPLQETLSMRLETFSTPSPTHLAVAALSIP